MEHIAGLLGNLTRAWATVSMTAGVLIVIASFTTAPAGFVALVPGLAFFAAGLSGLNAKTHHARQAQLDEADGRAEALRGHIREAGSIMLRLHEDHADMFRLWMTTNPDLSRYDPDRIQRSRDELTARLQRWSSTGPG